MTISKKPTNHSTTNISRRLTVMHRFSLYTLTIFIILILRYANSGPFLPLSCQLFGSKCPTNPSINGFVKQEFNGVKEIFKQNFINGDDIGAQITVYYDNEVVVDLQGGFADLSNGRTYNEDTLQLVFSSTKVLTGIVISRLVEQGLLDYNEKVSKYWPGFAQNNKENVTLLELITHKAGVGYIDSHQISNRDLHDLDKLSEILANQPHNFDGKPTKAYHGVSRGWYLNEIVRRVDPRHRTIGRIVKEEIMPIYNLEFYYSIFDINNNDNNDKLKSAYETRVSNIYTYPLLRLFSKILLPQWMIKEPLHKIFNEMMNSESTAFKTLVMTSPDKSQPQEWNNLEMLKPEGPSYNGITNSRSMAKLGAMMANGGKSLPIKNKNNNKSKFLLKEPDLMSSKTFKLVTKKLAPEFDNVLQEAFPTSIGGFGYFKLEGLEDVELVGWGGSGGSMFLWNEELKISFAYCMNAFHTALLGDKRSLKMIKEVVDTVKKLRNIQ
ncbi:1432_t:CDS:2 [Entrophospora sp. SA101]|nr:1432_t:CDS:2 [Entrophospora sp. SA101]